MTEPAANTVTPADQVTSTPADQDTGAPSTGKTEVPEPQVAEYDAEEFEALCDKDPRLKMTMRSVELSLAQLDRQNSELISILKAIVIMNRNKPVIVTKWSLGKVSRDTVLSIKQDPGGRGLRITTVLEQAQNDFLKEASDERPAEQAQEVPAANGENSTPAAKVD